MMNDERWAELQQAEDMAYFRADLCCYSPESYSLDEKKEIFHDMMSVKGKSLDEKTISSSWRREQRVRQARFIGGTKMS